jgi:hypothetical protein
MSCDAGHFENPGALARLKSNGANVGGGDWHRGTRVMTEEAWPSPSQVGEDEVALDEVTRGSSGRAVALERNAVSRTLQWGRWCERWHARDAFREAGRWMRNVLSFRGTSNRGRQRRASEAKRSPLHAGLAVRADAAMAPACGRNGGHAT